jgi:hypothetical protein
MAGAGYLAAAVDMSLGWNAAQLYIRWPRIGVVIRQTVFIDVGPPGKGGAARDKLHLIVVNNGAEAATIANVGLRSEDRSRTLDIERLQDEGAQIDGPDLPARVEAHGALAWTIGYDMLDQFPRGTKLFGYAWRYKTFRKYPRSRRSRCSTWQQFLEHGLPQSAKVRRRRRRSALGRGSHDAISHHQHSCPRTTSAHRRLSSHAANTLSVAQVAVCQ